MTARTVGSFAALVALLAACAALPSPESESPGEDGTRRSTTVCVENETVHDVTVNVLDGETGNLVEWVHVGGHGSSAEDFRRLPTEITVGVDAVGFAQTYYPSGLRNVLVGNADSIGLEVGTDGLQPFAHSGVDPSPC